MTDQIIDIGFGRRKKVLVAEDEENIASLVEDWLSETYEVHLAYNGKSALQKAKWNQPDVILMDIMMPDMGGYEVVRALQSDPATSRTPVIAMTAKNFDDSTVKLIKGEANVMGFINKPFRRDALQAKILQVLSGRRAMEPEPSETDVTIPALDAEPGGGPSDAGPPADAAPVVTSPGTRPEDAEPRARAVPPPPAPSRTAMPAAWNPPTERPERPRRGGLGRWVFLAGTWLVSLAAAGEWACRNLETVFGREIFDPPLRATKDASLPFILAPGTAWRQGKVDYAIDAWGLRGGGTAVVKPPGAYRVFLLGGTALFGVGLPLDETAARRLEADLNAAPPAGFTRAEVVNGALWGYDAAAQWAFFEKAGAALGPDAVVWVVDRRPRARPDPDRTRRWARLPAGPAAALSRSRLARLLKHRSLTGAPAPEEAGAGRLSVAHDAARALGATLLVAEIAAPGTTDGARDDRLSVPEDAAPDAAGGPSSRSAHRRLAALLAERLRAAAKTAAP